MRHPLLAFAAAAILFGVAAPAARACDDNTDVFVKKIQKVDLSTQQLKSVFAYHAEHKAFIAKSHREGLGCLQHERHQADFEKAAIGVLDDGQFKTFTGRVRTESESLRYENHLLKTEVERLKAELEALRKEIRAAKTPAVEKTEKKEAGGR